MAVKRSLGIVGVLQSASDWILGVMERTIEDEIIRRIDAEPNDDLDSAYFRTRARDIEAMDVKLEFGAQS